MQVKNTNVLNSVNTYKSTYKSKNEKAVEAKGMRDRVELSQEAKTLLMQRETEFQVDEKRVEELRRRIESGEYDVDSRTTAKSIFNFIKENRG